MVELTQTERGYRSALERRVLRLTEKGVTGPSKKAQANAFEQRALTWALEVINHAAATNCEEAFAFTTIRCPLAERDQAYVKLVAAMEVRQKQRQKDIQASQELKAAARAAAAPASPEKTDEATA